MTVEQATGDRLATTAGVSDLVAARIWQLKLPQDPELPAVRVQFIGVVDFYHLRGGSLVEKSRIQVDAVATEASGTDPYADAAAVADAVHASLNGQRFTADATLAITGAFRDGRMAMYDPNELRQVVVSQDYFVWSRRAVA